MGIDYNEVAAYLEQLHHRLREYKSRRLNDVAMAALLAVFALGYIVFISRGSLPNSISSLSFFFLVMGAGWIGLRILQTSEEASELEKEVELLRYRLVADDVSLGKLKNDDQPNHEHNSEPDLDELAELGQLQVGDDGELVITPPADEVKRQSKR
jgi:hypothetical protein